jgi:hypothetical protein
MLIDQGRFSSAKMARKFSSSNWIDAGNGIIVFVFQMSAAISREIMESRR